MKTFGYGLDDKHITATDADGVALAAIQGLNHKLNNELQEKQAEIDRLKEELNYKLDKKQSKIDRLNDRLQSQEGLFKSLEQRLLELARTDG